MQIRTLITGIALLVLLCYSLPAQWVAVQVPGPHNDWLSCVHFPTLYTGYATEWSGHLMKTTDGGYNWQRFSYVTHQGNQNPVDEIFFTSADTGFAAGANNLIFKTVDGGQTWTSQTSPISTNFTSHGIDFPSASTGYIAGPMGGIIKTTNAGGFWTLQNSGVSSQLWGVDFLDDSLGMVAGDLGVILKTTDGGTNWTGLNSGVTAGLTSVQFTDTLTAFAVGDNATLIKTTDGGSTWTQVLNIGTASFKVARFFDSNEGYVAGQNLIYHTTDGGVSWSIANLPFNWWENDPIVGLAFPTRQAGFAVGPNGHYVNGSGTNNIIYQWGEIKAGIPAPQEATFEVYPNPASGAIWLRYEVMASEEVAFELTDLSGKLILRMKGADTGEFRLETDAFPAGMYCLRMLRDGNVVGTRRVVLE